MRVLIIGASGFIGQHLVRRLKQLQGYEITGTYWSQRTGDDAIAWRQVELTDTAGLDHLFQIANPEVVIHLAAIADVGTAEAAPERASAVNVTATSSIAQLSVRHGARMVFASTEYVFDGGRGHYREDETPSPTTHYGLTKWQAEQQVAQLATRWSILRTSIVYGWPGPGKRNFAPWLIERLRSGQPYHAPTDVYRTPVYVGHLTDGIARLVEGDYQGIHHIAGQDWVSMFDFATEIARGFGLDRGLVLPANAASGRAPSRDMLGLDCARTMQTLGIAHQSLAEGIEALRAAQ